MDRQTNEVLFDLKLSKDHELFNQLLKQGKVGIKEAKEIIAKEVLKLRVDPNDKAHPRPACPGDHLYPPQEIK